MLQAIRGTTGSWIVKIFFFFIAASFITWGGGEYIRGRTVPGAVATVGDVEITQQALELNFRNEVQRVRNLFGRDFTLQEAADAGLLRQTLDRLLRTNLLAAEADSLSLSAPTEIVADMIRQDPRFRDPVTGQFSRGNLEAIMRANGISEAGLIQLEQRRLAQETVHQTVARGSAAPDTVTEALFRYRNQMREVEAAIVRHSLIEAPEDPGEEELRRFYDAHSDAYVAPERRRLTVVELTPDLLADTVDISGDDLREAYEMRVAGMEADETRGFSQVVVQDEAVARSIAEAAQDPEVDLAAAAEEAAGDAQAPSVIQIPPSRRDDLPAEPLAEAVFSLPEVGAVGGPVQTSFGWHVVQLTAVQSDTASFEELRPDLEREILWDRSADALYELSNEVDDQLAGGATLEEAARTVNAPIIETPPLSAEGMNPQGQPYQELQTTQLVLEEAFQLNAGSPSRMLESPDGLYAVVRVDEIIESDVRPFGEVRGQVLSDWRDDRRAARAAEIAQRMADEAAAGASLAELAEAEPAAEFVTVTELGRQGRNRGDLPIRFVNRIFGGEVDEYLAASGNGVDAVGRTIAINEPDPADRQNVLANVRQRTDQEIQAGLQSAFLDALERKYDATIDEEAIAAIRFDG